MMNLTTLLRAVLSENASDDRLCAAIRECLGHTTHLHDGFAGQGILNLQEALGPYPGRHDDLHAALHTANQEASIGDWVGEGVWAEALDKSVKEMKATSNCGADCMSIIMRMDWVLADFADIDPDMRDLMVEAAAHQCRVFVNG